MTKILRFIFFSIILLLVQILILDKLFLLGLPNIYIYFLILLLIPYKFNRVYLMLIAFGLGFFLDMFNSTPGLHSIAATFIAFIRNPLLAGIANFNDYDNNVTLTHKKYGLAWLFKYYGMIILTHNTLIVMLQYLTFVNFIDILIRIIISITVSLFFVLIGYMFYK
jgi:hypothetical protein